MPHATGTRPCSVSGAVLVFGEKGEEPETFSYFSTPLCDPDVDNCIASSNRCRPLHRRSPLTLCVSFEPPPPPLGSPCLRSTQ